LLVILLLLGVFAFPETVAGQNAATPRSLGMGGATIGMASGIDALHDNPANLGMPGSPGWSISLANLQLGGRSAGVGLGGLLRQSFGESYGDIDRIIASTPAGGAYLDGDVQMPVLGLQLGPFAAAVTYRGATQNSLSRDAIDLIYRGVERNRYYGFENTVGSVATHWDVSVGYGRKVGPVMIGAAGRYINAGSISRYGVTEGQRIPDSGQMFMQFDRVGASGGHGFGVDLGVSYVVNDRLVAGMSVSNLLSMISWSDDIGHVRQTIRPSEFESTFEPQDLLSKPPAVRNLPAAAQPLADALYDGARLPGVLRSGVALAPVRGMRVGVQADIVLSEGWLTGTVDDVLAVGVQQQFGLFAARAGYVMGRNYGNAVTAGLRLGVLDAGVALGSGTRGVDYGRYSVHLGLHLRGRARP
jgi:hypothetical protein